MPDRPWGFDLNFSNDGVRHLMRLLRDNYRDNTNRLADVFLETLTLKSRINYLSI